jgi:hypothetical protein
VIGSNAPKRKVSLMPPPPELVAGDVAEGGVESVTVLLG